MGFFSKGLKNEFETAVVNESSVFEPLEVYCMLNVAPLKLGVSERGRYCNIALLCISRVNQTKVNSE